MSLGGGSSKTEYPTAKNILDLRTPEAQGFENDLRTYFQGVLSQPNMGYQPRQTFDPMELYMNSMSNRGDVTKTATSRTPSPSPWTAEKSEQAPLGRGTSFSLDSLVGPPPASSQTQTPFGLLTPRTAGLLPDWATIPAGAGPGAALRPGSVESGQPGPTSGDPTEASIATLYRTILGREPDPEGLEAYLRSGKSLKKIEKDMRNSTEARSRANTGG